MRAKSRRSPRGKTSAEVSATWASKTPGRSCAAVRRTSKVSGSSANPFNEHGCSLNLLLDTKNVDKPGQDCLSTKSVNKPSLDCSKTARLLCPRNSPRGPSRTAIWWASTPLRLSQPLAVTALPICSRCSSPRQIGEYSKMQRGILLGELRDRLNQRRTLWPRNSQRRNSLQPNRKARNYFGTWCLVAVGVSRLGRLLGGGFWMLVLGVSVGERCYRRYGRGN